MSKFKFFCTLFCIFLITAFLSRFISHTFNGKKSVWESKDNIIRRYSELENNYNTIFKTDTPLSLFIGYSNWHLTLDTRTYDKILAKKNIKSISYNFSFMGQMGLPLSFLSTNIAEQLKARNKKVENIFIEITPLSLSHYFHRTRPFQFDYWYPWSFYRSENTLNYFKYAPIQTVKVILYGLFQPFDAKVSITRDRYSKPEILNFFSSGLWFEKELWNLERFGNSKLTDIEAVTNLQQFMTKNQSEKNWELIHKSYIEQMGIHANFLISKTMLENTLDAAAKLKPFTKNIYFVITPVSPKLESVASHIKFNHKTIQSFQDAGINVIDLSIIPQLTDKDFIDPMHPTPEASNKFMELLVEKVL